MDDYPHAATAIANVLYDKDCAETEPWRCIPRDVDLTDWIRIQPWKRRTPTIREHRVLFTDAIRRPLRSTSPWTVSLSLYGFIENMNLSPTGNWDMFVYCCPGLLSVVAKFCVGARLLHPKPSSLSAYAGDLTQKHSKPKRTPS